jgi:hypothetical protein
VRRKAEAFSALQAAEPLILAEFSHRFPRDTLAGDKVMSNQNIFSTLIVTWVAVPSLAMFLASGSLNVVALRKNF